MRAYRRRFEVDRAEGKLLGVCAGLANSTGIDATIIRIAVVLATIAGGWPWTVILYVGAAIYGSRRAGRPAAVAVSREESRDRIRNIDLRMQAIETYVTSSNSKLAREIEALRQD
jgi:phage shock protein C